MFVEETLAALFLLITDRSIRLHLQGEKIGEMSSADAFARSGLVLDYVSH